LRKIATRPDEFRFRLASTSGRSPVAILVRSILPAILLQANDFLARLATGRPRIQAFAANISDHGPPRNPFPALLRKSVTTGDICHSSMLALRLVPLIVMRKLPIQVLTHLERCSISLLWKKISECSIDRSIDRSHRKSPIMGPTPAQELNRGGRSAAIF
jgi:hypothetical protein